MASAYRKCDIPLVAVEMEHIAVVVEINRESCMVSDEAERSWCLFRGG